MKIIPLGEQTKSILGVSHKIVLDYTDFNGAGVTNAGNTAFTAAWTSGTGQSIMPPTLQAGQVGSFLPIVLGATTDQFPAQIVIGKTYVNVITAFASSGGALGSLTFSLGDAGSATRFANAVDLTTKALTLGTGSSYVEAAASNLMAVATIAGQTMASLNAGQIEIYCTLENITDLLQVH